MDLLDEAQKKADATNTQTHTVPDLSELLHAVPPATDAAQNTEPQPQNTVDSPPAFDIHSFDTPASKDSNSQPSPVVEDSHFAEQKTPGELVPEEPAPLPPQDPVIQNFGAPEQQKNATDPLLSIPAAPTAPPPQKKKGGFKRAFLFASVAFLLLAVPVIGFFVNQQRQIADTRSQAACGTGEAFCGGCIGACRLVTQKTCNKWIQEECQQQGCAGNGVYANGQSCCAGLQLCGNGRCAPSCNAPPTNTPVPPTNIPQATNVPNSCNDMMRQRCADNGWSCIPNATGGTCDCKNNGQMVDNKNKCCSKSGYTNGTLPSGQYICAAATIPTNTPTTNPSCGTLNSVCCTGRTCNSGLICERQTDILNTCVPAPTSTPSCKPISTQVNSASECCSNYTITANNGNKICSNPAITSSSCKTTGNSAPSCNGKSIGFDNGSCTCQISTLGGGDCLCRLKSTNPTSPLNPSCSAGGASCETTSCCSGLVCQGVLGSRKCEQPAIAPDAQCRVGGNTTASCGRILAFHCNSSFASECLENPQQFDTREQAIAYINGCGQLDVVCNGGPNENKLCGDFTIYKNSCGQNPTSPPQPTTPPAVAQCQNIKIYRNGTVLTTNQFNTIKSGQQLVIAVVGANTTKARFTINTQLPIETTTKNSAGEYTITYTVPAVTTATNFTIQAEVFGNNGWK